MKTFRSTTLQGLRAEITESLRFRALELSAQRRTRERQVLRERRDAAVCALRTIADDIDHNELMPERESFNGSKMLRGAMAKSAFLSAYVDAMFFTEAHCDAEESMRDAGVEDVSFDLARSVIHDCAIFEKAFDIMRDLDIFEDGEDAGDAAAGHDFWLTRNGHGAGFWDGCWPKQAGEQLSALARTFGEVSIYRADDGLLYS